MDPRVKQFLEQLRSSAAEKAAIVDVLREIFTDAAPGAVEGFMYGGVVYTDGDLLGGVFVRKNHVTVELGEGARLDDPHGVLEGKGRDRRHIKIFDFKEIETKQVKYHIEELMKYRSGG